MAEIVLQVEDLHLYRGARPVLTGVSLDVERGELVAIMGPSGSGKTTVLRAVAGLESFQGGRIVIDGVALTGGTHATKATLRVVRMRDGRVNGTV